MLVFIRSVTESLSVHEDLLGLVSLHSTTLGLDVKEAVLKLLRDRVPDLPLSKLVGLTTDGAPSMTGKENGAVSLLKKHLRESKFEREREICLFASNLFNKLPLKTQKKKQ